MNFDEIKKLIDADGGKFIFVEDGNPTIVVVSFEDYKKRLFSEKNNSQIKESRSLPLGASAQTDLPKELKDEALKIEDLPL